MNKLRYHKLPDLYEISSGISTTKQQAGHGSPFVSYSDVYNNYFLPEVLTERMDTNSAEQETYSVKAGDVFLTRTSETLDELAMSSIALRDYPEATFSGFTKRLRPRDHKLAYPKFMGFFFRSGYFRKIINNVTTMTTRASFNETIFGHIEVALPDIEDQRCIGDFLYSLEEKIQINQAVNHRITQQLSLLYGYWFLQFSFPDSDGAPYREANNPMTWNDELGMEIPSHWTVAPLTKNSLCNLIKPGVDQFHTKTYIATSDVVGTSLGSGSIIDYETHESRANMQPTLNSIWFARMKASRKHLFLNEGAAELIDNSILSTGFCGLQANETSFPYISTLIASPYFEQAKDRFANGATQQAVSNADLKHVKIAIPDHDTLSAFAEIADPLISLFNSNIMENQSLAAARDWMLPFLINGQAHPGPPVSR